MSSCFFFCFENNNLKTFTVDCALQLFFRLHHDQPIPTTIYGDNAIYIVCKIGAQGYKEALAQQAENLKQLQVEYVDLLLIHWSVLSTAEPPTRQPQLPKSARERVEILCVCVCVCVEGGRASSREATLHNNSILHFQQKHPTGVISSRQCTCYFQ